MSERDDWELDTIEVRGIVGFGRHGVLVHERAIGQTFSVDVRVRADLSRAGASDELGHTIDYGRVAALAHERIVGPPFALIERLAEVIAADVADLPGVVRATVTVHKPHAPMPVPTSDVTVSRTRRAPQRVVLGLGANLGDRLDCLQQALVRLSDAGVCVEAVSPVVETDPVGGPEQADYLNAVAVVRTTLGPYALLGLLHAIEDASGRVRDVRWGPRTLDLDILDFAGRTLDAPDLLLPHPRAMGRGFVLVPWAAVAPHDVLAGREVREHLQRLSSAEVAGVRPTVHTLDLPGPA
ncbi:MAG: hypothetical protein RLZ55_111 [Actinomycetota bacterium]